MARPAVGRRGKDADSVFLLALAAAVGLSCLLQKPLKKRSVYFYWGAGLLSALLTFGDFSGLPAWVNTWVLGLFRRGTFATALWCIVMITGALPAGVLRKIWLPIRGQLSILAAIITLCHNITCGRIYFAALFGNAGSLPPIHLAAALISLLLLAIMLPLTVMSFPAVRRKMPAGTWKRIQRLAYGFYGLLYIHILLMLVPAARMGLAGYQAEVLLYSLVFLGYAVARITKAVTKNAPATAASRAVGALVLAVGMAIVCLLIFLPRKSPALPEETLRPLPQASSQPETEEPRTTAWPETSALPESTASPEATASPETSAPVPARTEAGTQTSETAASSEPEQTAAPETAPTLAPESRPAQTTAPTASTEAPTQAPTREPAEDPTQAPSEAPTQPPTEAPATVPTVPPRKYKDGTYTATVEDQFGHVTVTVEIRDDVILSVTASSDDNPWPQFSDAKKQIPGKIVSAQSPEVDVVSGATVSSEGIKEGVRRALAQAEN